MDGILPTIGSCRRLFSKKRSERQDIGFIAEVPCGIAQSFNSFGVGNKRHHGPEFFGYVIVGQWRFRITARDIAPLCQFSAVCQSKRHFTCIESRKNLVEITAITGDSRHRCQPGNPGIGSTEIFKKIQKLTRSRLRSGFFIYLTISAARPASAIWMATSGL